MKTKLAILAAAVVLFIVSILLINPDKLKPVTVFKPGTKIGNLNLSRTPWGVGYANLNSQLKTPFYINLESKSRGVTPEEIGIGLDRDKLSKLSTTCRTKLLRIFCRHTSNERIDPNTIFTIDEDKLNTFLTELDQDVAFLAKNTIISFETNTFRALSPEANVSIDKTAFSDPKSLAEVITTENFVLDLSINKEDNKELQREATEQLIKEISAPLLIKYGGTPIYIPKENVAKFLGSKEIDGLFYGEIKKEKIAEYLDSLKKDYASTDVQILRAESIDAVARTVLFRAANYEINNAVILPLIGKPKTSGELHTEYLELVKSQQRMYKFKEGRLEKTYIISTGLTWDTPSGKFEILGKQKMTVSYYDNWYMPNYLPIGTIDGYFFGFHEIPYHMDGAGNIYSRDPNTMGSPATGGCIQLTAKDSLELFEQTPVGTPVYIYE